MALAPRFFELRTRLVFLVGCGGCCMKVFFIMRMVSLELRAAMCRVFKGLLSSRGM